MEHTIWQSIASTPWWIQVLIAYLFWLSFLATRPRLVPVKNVTLLPMIPILISLVFMMYFLPSTKLNLNLWFGGLMLGIGSGYLQFDRMNIKLIDSTIHFPGSWVLFVFLAATLAAKVYFGFAMTISLELLTNPYLAMGLFLLYGVVAGLFIGRNYYLRKLISHSRTKSFPSAA